MLKVTRPAVLEMTRPAMLQVVTRAAMLERRLQVVVARHAVRGQHLAGHAAVRLGPRLTRQPVLTGAQPTLRLFELQTENIRSTRAPDP
jgi:hypothetical protein